MKSKTANQLVEAVMHYQKTGNHKQVVINYNPAKRTEYEFGSWKHERDHHSPRAILPEDIKDVSKTYKLNKTEEVTVLAYVKFLELMINSVGRMEEEEKKGIGKEAVSPVNDRMYG